MSKATNKKIRRARGNLKANKARQKLIQESQEDVYDHDLKKERKIRSNFYTLLRDACYNPERFKNISYTSEYAGTGLSTFSDTIIAKKFGLLEKRSLSKLIEICKRSKIIDRQYDKKYINGLINVVKWSWLWQDNPELWHPDSKNRDRQFFSLVRFLFCKYEVPQFMDKCWYETNKENEKYQEWYINMGQGENIRKQAGLPVKMTKKMAHEFIHAPSNLDIPRAIKWAYVKSMGANKRTALAILGTPLGTNFNNNEFWDSVIRFYINNPMLDTHQYGPIYDYILNQKFTPRGNVFVDGALVHLGPPQPNFSMHRRNANTLLRQVEIWHRNITREQRRYGSYRKTCKWESCGLSGYKRKTKDAMYIIEEILTSNDLYAEGDAQRHCVGSYVLSCAARNIAIFSLRRIDETGMTREATISVNLKTGTVGEARKKCNARITNHDAQMINAWAKECNLQISSWIR